MAVCVLNDKQLALCVGPAVARTTHCCVCVLQEEFCFPVECLSLTVEEVMHIRQVLVKAELEKFQQYKEIYNAMKKGKVTSSCMTHIACIMYSVKHKHSLYE